MICISQLDIDVVSNIIVKNLTKLCTSYGMYEICDSLNLVSTLFYHSHSHQFMLFLSENCRHISAPDFSINDKLYCVHKNVCV